MSRTNMIGELIEMHKYARPGGSTYERLFSARYIKTLKGVRQDEKGNWIGQIGAAPKVLWSSHTDTVHTVGGFQTLAVLADLKPEQDQHLFLSQKEKVSNCLGADCTVGVWLMRRMYLARVPGLYIWHALEETGGHGSRHIATATPELLSGIEAAIAFDRKGTDSVITHQWGGRCASDTFGKSLSALLPGNYKLDKGGTFTDTANYSDLIPECTNVSVGYQGAHTSREQTNLGHAQRLLDALLKFDQSKLVIERKPGEDDPVVYGVGWVSTGATKRERKAARRAASPGGNQYGGYGPLDGEYDWYGGYYGGAGSGKKSGEVVDLSVKRTAAAFVADSSGALTRLTPTPEREQTNTELDSLEARFRANPRRAAELWLECGYSYDDIVRWW